MEPPLTAVVADDEPLARAALRRLLAEAGVAVAAEAATGAQALDAVAAHAPDILFLDVQMPGLSGLDVLDRLDAAARDGRPAPTVVLTTAFDQYALAAYEFGAVDYLLKPFGAERLHRALARVSRGWTPPEGEPALVDRAAVVRAALDGEPVDCLLVRERGRIVPVRLADVVHLEAQGDYALLHTVSGGKHLAYLSLNAFEARLDAAAFLRVHRSHVVNLAHVQAFVPYDASRLAVELDDGTTVVASRTRSKLLRRYAH